MNARLGISVVIAFLALAGASAAQTPPAPGSAQAAPRRAPDSAFALGAAYREIGRAETAGATGHYIDEARRHYRSAIDRHGRNDDAGAAAEARLAADLASVALDERPANALGPKDIPAPPTPRASTLRVSDGTTMTFMPPGDGMRGMPGPDGPGFGRMPMIRIARDGGFGMRHRYDATALAEVLKVETSPEARQLAQNAVDANAAAQKAALAGNAAEAARQTRISDDLAAAVHDLAALNHPELGHRTMMLQFRTAP